MSEITPQLQDVVALAREWIGKKFPDWKLTDFDLKRFDPSFDLSRDENVLFVSGNIEMNDVSYSQLEKIVKQVNEADGQVRQHMSQCFTPENMDIDIFLRLVYHEPSESILTNDEACEIAPKAFEEFC